MSLSKTLVLAAFAPLFAFAASITVENAYVKEVAPNMKNSAAFMLVKNSSDKKVSLLSAKNDASAITELHTHTHKDGMMVMNKVDKIEVPAKGEVALKPMGFHVMLIELKKPLKAGESVNLELSFDNGESVKVAAPVKK